MSKHWSECNVRLEEHLYSDRYTRKVITDPPSFSIKPDNRHTYPNYSIHPWRNSNTGRRQVYNTCKKSKKK